MSASGPPTVPRLPATPAQRAGLMCLLAGGLGVLSFLSGFLEWITEGDTSDSVSYGGYAVGSPALAIIGFSVAAGLLAVATTVERKPASLTPVVLSVTSLLLLVGLLIGKRSISTVGTEHVGVGIGLALDMATVLVQVAVLSFAWLTASGRIPANRAPALPAQPQPTYRGQPYPGQPSPGQPDLGRRHLGELTHFGHLAQSAGGYGEPQTFGPWQPPPAQRPSPGDRPPPADLGYDPSLGR
jgi:Family of unknown function (DUF5336)